MSSPDFYSFMVHHHEHLDELYARLLEAMHADSPDVCRLWTELDHELIAHLEAEEHYVLPMFAQVDANEASSLLGDHGDLRAELLELGVAVDLHQARYERAVELVKRLRAHADREDRLLYRWADQNLDDALVAATLAHVGHELHFIAA